MATGVVALELAVLVAGTLELEDTELEAVLEDGELALVLVEANSCDVLACVENVPVEEAGTLPLSAPDTGGLLGINPPSAGAVDGAAEDVDPEAVVVIETTVAGVEFVVVLEATVLVGVGLAVAVAGEELETTAGEELGCGATVPGGAILPPSAELGA